MLLVSDAPKQLHSPEVRRHTELTVLQNLGSFVLLYDIGLTDTLLTKNKVNNVQDSVCTIFTREP